VDADGSTANNPTDGSSLANNITAGFTPAGLYWADRSPVSKNVTSYSGTWLYQSDDASQAFFGGNPYYSPSSEGYLYIGTNASLKSGTAYFVYNAPINNNREVLAASHSGDLSQYQYIHHSNYSTGQYLGLATNGANDSLVTNDNYYGGSNADTFTNEPLIVMYDRPTDGDEIMIAESMRTKAAATLGLSTRAYPADWNGFGQNRKAAGVVRNQKMLDCEHTEAEPIDICIAFHDNIAASRGTRDMLNRVIKANVPALLVTSCSKRFITETLT
jgi:hypothetical protein